MRPKLTFQPESARFLQDGVHQIVGAIAPTLGPRARQVIYGTDSGFVEFLDDGGSIARRIIQVQDPDADMGAMFARQVLWRVGEHVGDGVATSAVLLRSLFDDGLRYVTAGADAMRLRHCLEEGLQVALGELDSQILPIVGAPGLAAVAETICHDAELAQMLGEIFDIIGVHGRFETRKGMDRGLRREYVEGSYWEGSLHSRHLLSGLVGGRLTIEDPAILLSNVSIQTPEDVALLYSIAKCAQADHLVAVVKDIDEAMLGMIHSERFGPAHRVLPVKFRTADVSIAHEYLSDLASLTGATPLVSDAGQSLQSVTIANLGATRRFWVDTDHMGFVRGKGDPVGRRAHLAAVERAFEQADAPDRRDQLLARLGRLKTGNAVLHVGAPTELEIESRCAIIDRTVRVLRGAVVSGVLPGGGTAFLRCREAMVCREQHAVDFEERAAYRMLASAMEAPLRQLAANAGLEPGQALHALQDGTPTEVFDLRTNRVEDAVEAGVLDVAAVQAHALEQAVRGVALLLTAEVLVYHRNPVASVAP